MQVHKPGCEFGLCAKYVHISCMPMVARKVELLTFNNFSCDEYDEEYMLVRLSHNYIPQEFNNSEALDMVPFHDPLFLMRPCTMT